MEKRLALALGISMLILFAWWKIFPPRPPVQPPSQAPAAATAPAAPAPGAATAGAGSATGAAAPATRGAEEKITVETPHARYVFSSWGGMLRELRLKDEKFRADKADPMSGPVVVAAADPQHAPLALSFPKADFRLPDDVAWQVQRPAPDTLTFRAETPEIAVEKRYHIGDDYQVDLAVTVENRATRALSGDLAVRLWGHQDPDKKGGGFLGYSSANVTEMVCYANDKVERRAIEPLHKEQRSYDGNVRWIAADEKFFTIAVVPQPDDQMQQRRCVQRADSETDGEVSLTFASRSLAPGAHTTYPMVVFAGPKYADALEKVNPGKQDAHLKKVINVTFVVIARPLLDLLKFFFRISHNWGVAIILLTLFVRLLTFYPTYRQMASGRRMQKLAPEVAKLRKKYENDKQKQGAEMMALYKQHGVSPLGGCLPALIQMPIWIALFSTLNTAVELYRSSFLYIHDLSAKDPFWIAPLLMGVVMFLQMRMTPAGADPQQQKMMAVMMPIMFTGFSLFLPAGLAVYTLTSYLVGIFQQLLVNYTFARKEHAAAGTRSGKR